MKISILKENYKDIKHTRDYEDDKSGLILTSIEED
jgi:hypothetical protein